MKYKYLNGHEEISGFGGSYEAACRRGVTAAMEWFDAHPDADPKFKGYKGVFGLCLEDNDDARALSRHIDETINTEFDDGLTGAMHHAIIHHTLAARRLGWDVYLAKMTTTKA